MISRREALLAMGGGLVGAGAGTYIARSKPEKSELSSSEIYELARQSIFTARAGDSVGTAFCFGSLKDGRSLIVSAYHIYDDFPRGVLFQNEKIARVSTYEGENYGLEGPYSFSDLTDAFAFTIEDSFPPLLLADEFPGVGEPIYVLGNPGGVEDVFTKGLVSGYQTKKEHIQVLSSAPIAKGSSGSPVLNKYGEVVGMITEMGKGSQFSNFSLSSISLNGIKNTLQALASIEGRG